MSDFPLEELENLIPSLLEETRQLREQNSALKEECALLKTRLEEKEEQSEQLGGSVQRVKDLESRQKILEQERSALRLRVKRLLESMEKIDFL